MPVSDDIRLVVFDLDFTLWDCGGTWVDCTTPPFEERDGRIVDQAGNHCHLYEDVIPVLDHLQERGKTLALASRTHDPEAARSLLNLLGIADRFPHQQIFPGSKLFHFEKLQKDTGLAYKEMVFFDDEMRNIVETNSLGVTAIHVANGLNWSLVETAQLV